MRQLWRAYGATPKKTMATAGAVAILAVAVVVAAVRSDGATATNVQLNDASVWVTNSQSGLIGRLNVQIDELDYFHSAAQAPDVLQDGRSVVFQSKDQGVVRVEPITGDTTGDNEAKIENYRQGGGVAALYDPATGNLWVGPDTGVVAPEYPKKPDARIETGAHVVVTAGAVDLKQRTRAPGRLFVVGGRGLYEIALGPDRKPIRPPVEAASDETGPTTTSASAAALASDSVAEAPPEPLPEARSTDLGVDLADVAQVSAVGDHVVVLTSRGEVVVDAKRRATLQGTEPRLQQVGPDAREVLVATTAGLFGVELGSGDVRSLSDGGGTPAAPVRVGPCAFGAWSDETPSWTKVCNGRAVVDNQPIEKAAPRAELVFRVNQNNVALNSWSDGGAWADHDGTLAFVGNWKDAASDIDPEPDDPNDGQSIEVKEKTCVDGGDLAPRANDDAVGVRPKATIIDLLYNDDDPNCEPIAIANPSPSRDVWGQLTVIDNGQHVLYSPSSEWQKADNPIQSFKFQYEAIDAGGHSSGPRTATVRVVPYSQNTPPGLREKLDGEKREMRTVVEEGKSVAYDVLGDWYDPDGDELRLESATPTKSGEVQFTSEGIVRYLARGAAPGDQKVSVVMSDGTSSASEEMTVTVEPAGSDLAPVTSDDFLTISKGAVGTVRPLENDSDPNGDELGLVPDASWSTDARFAVRLTDSGKTVEVTGIEAGSYLLRYQASDGSQSVRGSLLLKVLDATDGNTAPVAVPDRIAVRPNRVLNIDVLANDVDLNGDVLSIVSAASVPASDVEKGEVRATVIDRRLVQLEVVPGPSGREPTGPFVVSYQLRDGFEETRALTQDDATKVADAQREQGTINVLIQPAASDRPPIATSDNAVVRTGDVVAIPVLRNDSDPDGDQLVLQPLAAEEEAKLARTGAGYAWTEGRLLYFQGLLPTSQPIALNYAVSAGGFEVTGQVLASVVARPDQNNVDNAPEPPTLELRAIRRSPVPLQIPLSGTDRDGDSTELVQVDGADLGNTVEFDGTTGILTFTAAAHTAPTDELTYVVKDRYGVSGRGTVRVAILPDISEPPQAHDDIVRAKPGRTITVPVLANDTSPQNRQLQLAEKTFYTTDAQESTDPVHVGAVSVLDQSLKENQGRIEVTVPTDGSTLVEHYRITDTRAGSSALLRVTPDPDAPNLPPIASPDEITLTEAKDRDVVTKDVARNDFDPDESGGTLTLVALPGQGAEVVGGQLSITMERLSRVVLYRLEDAEGGAAIGRVSVPGKDNHPPALNDRGKDVSWRTRTAETPTEIVVDLAETTTDPDGDNVLLTDTEISQPQVAGVSVRRADDNRSFTISYDGTALDQTARMVVSVEVTDDSPVAADGGNVACNCRATLNYEVVIEASSPPEIVGSGRVTVPQLDEVTSYSLSGLATDAQNDPLTFTLDPSRFGGLEIQQSGLGGSELTIVSHLDGDRLLAVGTDIVVPFTVSDGEQRATEVAVQGELVITIGKTNRTPPVPASFDAIEAERGVAKRLPNLTSGAVNAFAADGRKLLLKNATVNAPGQVQCDVDGNCTFTSDTVGSFTVTYTLEDAAKQAGQGSLSIVVKGKPRAPGIPGVLSVGDHLVNLTWTPADAQGSEILKYVVTATGAGTTATKDFTTPGGTFDGLRNNQEYTFTVIAVNALGDGERSGQSSRAIPDRVPDPPTSITFSDYGDRSVTVTWAVPPGDGSEFSSISNYEIRLGGQLVSVAANVFTTTFTNLTNGTTYDVEIRSKNNTGFGTSARVVGTGIDFSTPSRYPDPPTNVTGVNSGDGGAPRITVNWTPPVNTGGRPIVSYEVCIVSTSTCQTTPAGTTSAAFPVAGNAAYVFTVVAKNTDKNRANSDPSAQSAAVTAIKTPDVPVISGVASGDHQLVVAASSANNSGCSTVQLEYAINGGAWQSSPTFSALTNGTAYTVAARAKLPSTCGSAGVTYVSDPSPSSPGTPYGPLRQPTIQATGGGSTSIGWTWQTNRSDDARPGWSASLSGNCGAQGLPASPGATGTVGAQDFGYSANVDCTITVSAPGVGSVSANAPMSTPAPPVGNVSVGIGGPASGAGCWWADDIIANGGDPNQGCYFVSVSMSGWTGAHTVRCYSTMNFGGLKEFASYSTGNGGSTCGAYSMAGRWIWVTVDCVKAGADNQAPGGCPPGGAISSQSAQWPTN